MKILMKFSLLVAFVIGAVLLIGDNLGAQVVSTGQGNIYPNAVVVVPAAVVQPNQINNVNNFNNNNNIKPFFPNFFNPFFNPFFHPFFNNNFFDPFSGSGASPLLIP
ncbi:MAG TPA: hypothetical protein VLG39_00805 [Nitrospirota bacterium]|nr:hypothetical protein [Nitrospirota bacterium]